MHTRVVIIAGIELEIHWRTLLVKADIRYQWIIVLECIAMVVVIMVDIIEGSIASKCILRHRFHFLFFVVIVIHMIRLIVSLCFDDAIGNVVAYHASIHHFGDDDS